MNFTLWEVYADEVELLVYLCFAGFIDKRTRYEGDRDYIEHEQLLPCDDEELDMIVQPNHAISRSMYYILFGTSLVLALLCTGAARL